MNEINLTDMLFKGVAGKFGNSADKINYENVNGNTSFKSFFENIGTTSSVSKNMGSLQATENQAKNTNSDKSTSYLDKKVESIKPNDTKLNKDTQTEIKAETENKSENTTADKTENSKDDNTNIEDKSTSTEIKTEETTQTSKEDLDKKINENGYMVLLYDQNLINQISEVLNIPAEEIMDTLSEMGLVISDLAKPENLISFVQQALELENPESLLAVQNVTEIMKEIFEVASNVSYPEILEPNQDISQLIEGLNSAEEKITAVLLTNEEPSDEIRQDLNQLFDELNGEVIEKTISTQAAPKAISNELEKESTADQTGSKIASENLELEALKNQNTDNKQETSSQNQNTNSSQDNSSNQEKSTGKEANLNTANKLEIDKNIENQDEMLAKEPQLDAQPISALNFEKATPNAFENSFGQGLENFKENTAEDGIDHTLNNLTNIASFDKVLNFGTQKVQPQRNINSVEVISQIMNKIKTSVKTDVSEVKLLLRPDFLGEVSLKISTQNGIITAEFIAENQRVKEIIESNFSQLKDSLNEQGIEVSQLDVNVNDDKENQDYQDAQNFSFNDKSEKRVKDIINKIAQDEATPAEYVEENQVITSSFNYSV